MKTVYLAGPDVFFPDSAAHFEMLEARCRAHGLQGLRPSDGGALALKGSLTTAQAADRIYEANTALIVRADLILANLAPFRGMLEPDSGTVFEVGMAVALRKPVAAVVPGCHLSLEEKVSLYCGKGQRDASGALFDGMYGMLVEEFEQPLNLMLARSCAVFPEYESALEYLKAL